MYLSLKGISIKTLIIFFPVKNNWLPLFNWNIVESDVKRHNPNPFPINYMEIFNLHIFSCTGIKK